MAVTGEVDGSPQRLGTPIADISAGMYSTIAILSALHVRDRSGKGQYIDISLVESAISLLGNVSANHLISGEEATRYGNAHPNIVPYQAFRPATATSSSAAGNDRLYQSLCSLLGRDELTTDRAS